MSTLPLIRQLTRPAAVARKRERSDLIGAMECKGNECITNKGELMEMRKQQVTKKRVADKRAEEDGRKKAKVSKLEEILRKTVPISNEERAWMIPDEQVCLGPIASCYVFSWSSGSDRFRPVKNWDLPKDCRDACRVYNDDYLTYRQRHQRYDVGGESCSIFSKVQTGTTEEDQGHDCKALEAELQVVNEKMHDLVKSYEVMVKMYPTRVRLDAVYQKRVDWRKNGPKPRKEIDA